MITNNPDNLELETLNSSRKTTEDFLRAKYSSFKGLLKGLKNDGYRCPIAMTLNELDFVMDNSTQKLISSWLVNPMEAVMFQYMLDVNKSILIKSIRKSIQFPSDVTTFISLFDKGLYPDLELVQL